MNNSEQKISFMRAVNTFKSAIDAWKYQYELIAPIEGTVSFTPFLQENQLVQNGQKLFYIIPKKRLILE